MKLEIIVTENGYIVRQAKSHIDDDIPLHWHVFNSLDDLCDHLKVELRGGKK